VLNKRVIQVAYHFFLYLIREFKVIKLYFGEAFISNLINH
jgi:hypothetical protein